MYCVNILMVEDNLPFRTTCMLDNKGCATGWGQSSLYPLPQNWCLFYLLVWTEVQKLDISAVTGVWRRRQMCLTATIILVGQFLFLVWDSFVISDLKSEKRYETNRSQTYLRKGFSLGGALSKLAPSCVKWFTVVFSEKKFPFVVKRNWMLCWGHCHSTVFGM